MRPDFQRAEWASAFLNLFFDNYYDHGGDFINLQDFKGGYALYCFNVEGQTGDDIYNKQEWAHCRLELGFATAPTRSLSLILYGVFPGGFVVNKVRSVMQL